MSSNEPVKNECEVIYEMFHILNFICLKRLFAIKHIKLA